MEGDAVHEGDEEKGPMGAAFSFDHVVAVVYGKKGVGCF